MTSPKKIGFLSFGAWHPGGAKESLDENPPFAAGFLYGRCRARTSDLLGVNQALSQLS